MKLQWNLALFGALVVILSSQTAAAPPVGLKKISAAMETDAEIGKLKGGALCLSTPWRWNSADAATLQDDLLPKRFQKDIQQLGYASVGPDPKDLFAEPAEGDYLIAGRIEQLNADLCFPSVGFGNTRKSKGNAKIKVTWQIYSKAEQKVVATISTEGYFDRKKSITDGTFSVVLKAFDGAVGKLVQSSDFVAIYGAPPKPVSLPEPDPILPPGQTDPTKVGA
jgi:hypothetical protein